MEQLSIFLKGSLLIISISCLSAVENPWRSSFSSITHDVVGENQLWQELKAKNNLTIKPISRGAPINIEIRLVLSRLDQLDEISQTVKLHGWLVMNWTDRRLSWDSNVLRKNIHFLRLHSGSIWAPDITLTNRAHHKDEKIVGSDTPFKVFSNGSIFYEPPFSIEASCNFDFELFPWDTQTCALMFGSLTYSNYELRWILKDPPEDSLSIMGSKGKPLDNSNWELVERSTVANLSKQDTDFYGDTEFVAVFLHLKRKADAFAWSFIVLPFLVISGLNLLSLWIPLQIRVIVLVLNLILQMIHSCFLANQLPPAISCAPRLAKFYQINFLLTGLIIVINVILNSIANRDGRKSLPQWGWFLLDSKQMRFFAGLYDHTEPMAQPFASEEDEQDGHQHQMTLELPKVQKNGTENWLDFVTILDRILFVVLTVVYAFVDMYFLI